MAKGAKQPKIKLSQPIALEPRLRDILEKHGVRKGPTVDKVEALQKAATAKKWLFTIKEDRKDGLAHATLEVPGPDGLLYFNAEAMTIPLAMTMALCDALENGPQQSNFLGGDELRGRTPDPDGKDLPMFNGNGGVASVAEIILQETADELAHDIDEAVRSGEIAGVIVQADGTVGDAPANPWTLLHQVDLADVKIWKQSAPTDQDGTAVVEWEEGDDLNDRGFYLDPEFRYDPKSGEVRLIMPGGIEDALVWSRDVEPKKARAGAAPKASNVTADQAEALAAAGAQA